MASRFINRESVWGSCALCPTFFLIIWLVLGSHKHLLKTFSSILDNLLWKKSKTTTRCTSSSTLQLSEVDTMDMSASVLENENHLIIPVAWPFPMRSVKSVKVCLINGFWNLVMAAMRKNISSFKMLYNNLKKLREISNEGVGSVTCGSQKKVLKRSFAFIRVLVADRTAANAKYVLIWRS